MGQKQKKDLFVEIDDETQASVILILGKYPKLVVVTEEKGGTDTKPKIPNVCTSFDVSNINVIDLIKQEKWSF